GEGGGLWGRVCQLPGGVGILALAPQAVASPALTPPEGATLPTRQRPGGACRVPPTPASRTDSRPQAATSAFHPHAFPEGDVTLDVRGRRLRLRVIPGGVLVHLAADRDIVVAGRPLPAADRVRGAVAQVLAADRLGREIMVALD